MGSNHLSIPKFQWCISWRHNKLIHVRWRLISLLCHSSIEVEWLIYASISYTIIGSDNDMSPVRRQATIWGNDELFWIKTHRIKSESKYSNFKHEDQLDMSSAKFRSYFLGFNYSFCMVYSISHWGRDRMDAISQTTFSSAFYWMKMLEFQIEFYWRLFLVAQLTIFQHWFR